MFILLHSCSAGLEADVTLFIVAIKNNKIKMLNKN